jgi:ATP-binding protein involved in chromosome partitioning
MITQEIVKNALATVIDNDSGQDVVSAGLISGIVVRGDKIGFMITVAPQASQQKEPLRRACESAVKNLPGVASVTAVLTAHNDTPIAPKPQSGYDQPRERANWNLTPLDGVKRVIAIASGKGGVGKSTTAINLALALSALGQNVGVLDADIYGPSVPRMLGLTGQPDIVDGKMQPLAAHGLRCMSMGFITGDEAAILRGPMISKALQQMLRMTRWGTEKKPLDTLLVDMPPGTGDIHLSMVQQVPLAGAIIVTTPQAVAVIDARKCLKMFQKVNTPVLGVIENMSGGMFGSGGGKALAEEMGVPFLGSIGMDAAIVEATDNGKAYQGVAGGDYRKIAVRLV